MRPTWPRGARVLQHPLAQLQRQVANRHQVLVGLGREADHVVELQVLDAVREDQLGAVEDLVVGHRLVDHAAQAVGPGFRRDRDRALAALRAACRTIGSVRSSSRSDAGLIA